MVEADFAFVDEHAGGVQAGRLLIGGLVVELLGEERGPVEVVLYLEAGVVQVGPVDQEASQRLGQRRVRSSGR